MPILPIDGGRYGSEEIRSIFDDQNTLNYQLEIEACVAEAEGELNLIPKEAAKEIADKARSKKITVARVKELEAKSEHDTAAMVEALSEICSDNAKPWIHYGLTSYDIIDTRISLQIRDSLKVIEPKLFKLVSMLADKALRYRDLPAVGRTHGQHASIISFGLKFAVWVSDMLAHIERLKEMKRRVLLCKTLGVVGTGSLMGIKAVKVQELVASKLSLYPVEAATQVISRERHAEFLLSLALIGSTLDKIAVEIRNLQRTEISEVSEPFKEGQMGSSAVPVKRNPIKSERVSSLARILKGMSHISLENISLWHERDLSNSANERFTIPIFIILLDEMLNSMISVISGLKIHDDKIRSNIEMSKGQIFAEFVLDALIKKGISRIEAYRMVQSIAFSSTEKNMHFLDALLEDERISSILSKDEIKYIFDPKNHLAASGIIIDEIVKRARSCVS